MKHLPVIVLILLSIPLAGCVERETAPEAEEPESTPEGVIDASWAYEGEAGPEAWGDLSEAYATCDEGAMQSPVALRGEAAQATALPALEFDYGRASLQVEDTGYGFKATPEGEHTLQVGEDTYRLLQFHAHTPSEHSLDGELYPMTLHFVHQNAADSLAVVGVMVEEGAESEAYASFVEAAMADTMGTAAVESLAALLPSDRTYFTYDGSLTTPPCTEGVRWIVMQEPVALSTEQIGAFEGHGETNRPLQPIGDRVVRISN